MDNKLSKEQNEQLTVILDLVDVYFKYDRERSLLWVNSTNPLLGMVTPIFMIETGRYLRLRKFVVNSIKQNIMNVELPFITDKEVTEVPVS